jgi:amino-acid N-acetyltransferase
MIRGAREEDRPGIEALLRSAQLPIDGVADHVLSFFVVEEGDRIVAVGGIEAYGDAALLRSVVVAADAQRSGLGSLVTRRALEEARARRVQCVYLLTTTAERFFPRFGFEVIDRNEVPPHVRVSREFQGACPTSATVMRLDARGATSGP